MICRDVKLLDELCRVSGDDLRQLNEAAAAFRILLVDGIRETWQGGDPSESLLAAMEETDPQRLEERGHADVARVLAVDVPIIRLVFYIATADPDFGKVHADAVKRHKAYWTKTARRKISWHGFLATELTALAAWAHDWERGTMAVRSDYVPEFLVQGEFLE